MIFIVLSNVAALLFFAAILYVLKVKNVKFSNRVFAGLILGILLGIGLQMIYGVGSEELNNTIPWYNLIGNGYIKLLQMIAMPLVFISIILAFTKVTIGKNFGKMAALILAFLVGTTAIAAVVGITTTTIFDLQADEIIQGNAEMERGESLVSRSETVPQTLPQQLLELFPVNPFYDLTGARSTSTIAVVIFAAFLGFAFLQIARKEDETATTIKKGIDAL